MKMLLDEMLPKKLRHDFLEHEVFTTTYLGWNGKKNGELLELMLSNDFEVLLTFDRNIAYQQNFKTYPIPVCIFVATINTYSVLSPLCEKLKELIKNEELKVGINVIE